MTANMCYDIQKFQFFYILKIGKVILWTSIRKYQNLRYLF